MTENFDSNLKWKKIGNRISATGYAVQLEYNCYELGISIIAKYVAIVKSSKYIRSSKNVLFLRN